ncbi:MAG: S1 RNA-binding domain-containing protein, partial [Anaerolineae bacterium]|nr:S1 RNA-binding domain-containing protein [Anaerolineae bacterium]
SDVAAPSTMEALLEQEQDGPQVKKGDLLTGTIARTSPTEILIDIGLKSEGVISGKELERIDRDTLNRLKVGEQVSVYVLNPEDRNGNVVLSLSRALEEQDWRQAEEMKTSGDIFHGKVDGYNKGGLIVRFGRVRGFVPESQVSRDRRKRAEGADPQEKWGKMRGEDISVKVVEVDRARNRLILSEREAVPAMRENQKEKLLSELKVGDRKTGRVKSVSDFGAFVDVGGADGLVHLTEMSWQHITHPKELLKVGQEVEVEVISIDPDRKRIGLSMKRTQEDPWLSIMRKYSIGQLVQGTITKLTKFGAFARLVDAPEIEGLIHISELSDKRVNHPKEVVNEGEVRTLRVVKIDMDDRRMGLSIKRVDSPDYLEADYRRAMGIEQPPPPPPRKEPRQAPADVADFESAMLKEEERKRADRKRGGKKGGGGKRGGKDDFDDYEDEF